MKQQIKIKDPVEFQLTFGPVASGFVVSIAGNKATVSGPFGFEFSVPLQELKRRKGVSPKRVFSNDTIERVAFSVNDEVFFYKKNEKIYGRISHLNPKRARVQTSHDFWDVPYSNLYGEKTEERSKANLEKLTSIANKADDLLEKHKLHEWRFTFDNASRRAGSCSHEKQIITLSEQFCLKAVEPLISDTILHEIAHALVGAKHGHDAVWQAKAKEIGCSGERTHDVNFTAPRYIVSCGKCKIYGVRNKRGQREYCNRCLTPVTYELYSEELWNSYQK